MGLFAKLFPTTSRENIAEELGLMGSAELDARIERTRRAIEAQHGKSDMAVLLAISQIEDELLEEHYTKASSGEQLHTWHAIVEALYYKRLRYVPDHPIFLPPAESDRLKTKLSRTFRELRDSTPAPRDSPTLFGLRLTEKAMWECFTEDGPEDPALFNVWVRKILLLGYEAKKQVFNYRTP